MRQLIYGLIFLSGFSGLAYQVSWQKHLSILLGSHASATAAVLALFFLFLSLGYAIIGKYATRLMPNQLLLYALIELVIGLYGIYSAPLFKEIYDVFIRTPGLSGQGLLGSLPLCAAFIFLPTFLMGGTIPVLTQALSKNFDLSADTHSKIYGINALGATAGCLFAGLILLEKVGVDGTLMIAGNINILVAVVSAPIALKFSESFLGPIKTQVPDKTIPGSGLNPFLLVVSFMCGFYTFALENLVIRMVGVSIGSSTYSYSVVVAAFILSISLGSLVLASGKKAESPQFYGWVQVSSFLAAAILFLSVPNWPIWFFRIRTLFQSSLINFEPYLILLLLCVTVILLIPVGLLGANLPLLFSLLRKKNEDLSANVGRLYAVNSIGSVFGATLGGYWVFSFFSADQAFKMVVVLVGLAAILTCLLQLTGLARRVAVGSLFLAAIGVSFFPRWDDESFVPGYFLRRSVSKFATSFDGLKQSRIAEAEKFLFVQHDANTYAAVTEDKLLNRTLYVGAKPDSSSAYDKGARAMAVLTPMMLKPTRVESVFIVGLGGGLSTGLISGFPEVKRVEVAEISEGVVNSLSYFEAFNYGLAARMDKVKITVGDAYRILIQRQQKFDLIISEPSNTWVSGVEKLFTKEFYAAGLNRLNDDGLYVQWFPLFAMSPDSFLLILKTFQNVFPHTAVFAAQTGALTLVGSRSGFQLNESLARSRFSSMEKAYRDFEISSPNGIWIRQLLGAGQIKILTREIEDAHSLFNTSLEYASGRAFFAEIETEIHSLLGPKVLLPSFVGSNDFLIDQNSRWIDSEALLTGLKLRGPHWAHFETFLLARYLRSGLKLKEFASKESELQNIGFLLDPKVKPDLDLPTDKFETVALTFKRLLVAMERPYLSQLLLAMGRCRAEACLKRKRAVVMFLAPVDIAQKVGQMDEATLDQALGKIKAAYKSLNYDSGL